MAKETTDFDNPEYPTFVLTGRPARWPQLDQAWALSQRRISVTVKWPLCNSKSLEMLDFLPVLRRSITQCNDTTYLMALRLTPMRWGLS
jgi:hypothetical protein